MFSKYLQCRTVICRTILSQYKRSESKWECLKLQRSNFHTTQKLHYPTPLILCFGSILCGLYTRKWWLSQTPLQQEKYIQWYRQRRHTINGTLGFMSLVLLVYCLTCFQRDPIMKKSRFIIFDETQQIENAKILFNLVVRNENNVVPLHDPMYARVARSIKRLSNSNKEIFKDINWNVTIIYRMFNIASIPNVLILPDRNIIILHDIFNFIRSDDQLTFILAHEMSHEMLLHGSETLAWGVVCDIATFMLTFLIWVLCEGRRAAFLSSGMYIFFATIFSWHKRRCETEADKVGFQLSMKSCIDPREVLVFWEIMKTFDELSGLKNFQLSLFMQHPSLEEREKKMIEWMPAALELRSRAECPELPLQDPRDYLPYYRKDIEKHMQKRLRILGMQL